MYQAKDIVAVRKLAFDVQSPTHHDKNPAANSLFVCLFIALGLADYIEPYQDHSPHLHVWPKFKSTQMVTLKAFR